MARPDSGPGGSPRPGPGRPSRPPSRKRHVSPSGPCGLEVVRVAFGSWTRRVGDLGRCTGCARLAWTLTPLWSGEWTVTVIAVFHGHGCCDGSFLCDHAIIEESET